MKARIRLCAYADWSWFFALYMRPGYIALITKTRLFKYIENFTSKNWKFSHKKPWYFNISAQNIDCGYPLEPPRRGGSNEYQQPMFWAEIRNIMYTPLNPSFTIEKWGLRGSVLYRHVFVMAYLFGMVWLFSLGATNIHLYSLFAQNWKNSLTRYMH